MASLNEILGRIICERREALGISQEELAHRANIHRTYVSQLERGLKSPTVAVLVQISAALDVEMWILIRSLERELDEIQGKE